MHPISYYLQGQAPCPSAFRRGRGSQGAGPLIWVQGLVPGRVPGQRPGPPEAYLQQGKKRPYKTTENFFMQKMPF
ncbi:hypothetical protein HMPREF1548_00082 [Clostridium sp. KLE 1755]|nr:hypothetical protein HMPREF1551_01190 [Capnocytophaga sp. oral taxon 863 str. F0517]ERI73071.1 hypothetical protein HMPREF1548_00082 [Clostridium sp. KLE 1755]MCC3388264.1 hypothetical protein [Enterocloster citroniae]